MWRSAEPKAPLWCITLKHSAGLVLQGDAGVIPQGDAQSLNPYKLQNVLRRAGESRFSGTPGFDAYACPAIACWHHLEALLYTPANLHNFLLWGASKKVIPGGRLDKSTPVEPGGTSECVDECNCGTDCQFTPV